MSHEGAGFTERRSDYSKHYTRAANGHGALRKTLYSCLAMFAAAGAAKLTGGIDIGDFIRRGTDLQMQAVQASIHSGEPVPSVVMSPGLLLLGATAASHQSHMFINRNMSVFEKVADRVVSLLGQRVQRLSDTTVPRSMWYRLVEESGVIVSESAALNTLEQTLIARGADYDAAIVEETAIVVCHRKHLPAALRDLSSFNVRQRNGAPITVFHPRNFGPPDTAAPCLLSSTGRGEIVAVWADESGTPDISIVFDSKGNPVEAFSTSPENYGPIELPTDAPALAEVVRRMQESVLRTGKEIRETMENAIYDEHTHSVARPADGSIVVRSHLAKGKVDNPYGPAVITAEGVPLYFRNGKPVAGPYDRVKNDGRHKVIKTLAEEVEVPDLPSPGN